MAINPLDPPARAHIVGAVASGYTDAEVQLANRNSGMPLEFLAHDITPVGAHYLLTHFDVPYVSHAADWTLELHGLFQTAAALTLETLQHYPLHTEVVTLECAGNGRACITPRWPSQPWHYGAVGTAEWTGVQLRDVLQDHPLSNSASELVFSGSDQGADGGEVHFFERSLTLEQIDSLDVMLVWAMNGQPLLPQHGFPLRLIVPGWYGMASVKWLNRITAIDHAFQGYQQVKTYRYRQHSNDTGTPVTTLKPKSLLQPPGLVDWSTRIRLVEPGQHVITGRAWSGSGVPIVRVELGLNGQYQEAILTPSQHRYGWSRWSAEVHLSEGQHTLSCRATDASGQVQPEEPVTDYSGMGNNGVQIVPLVCATGL